MLGHYILMALIFLIVIELFYRAFTGTSLFGETWRYFRNLSTPPEPRPEGLTFDDVPEGMTLDEFVQYRRQELQDAQLQLELLDEINRDTQKLAQHEAEVAAAEWRLREAEELRRKQRDDELDSANDQ